MGIKLKLFSYLLLIIALISTAIAIKNTLWIPTASLDLELRHNAAILLRDRQNPYTTLLPETQAAAKESYAPSIVTMLIPLSFLSFSSTKTLWLFLNFCATGLILWLLFQLLRTSKNQTRHHIHTIFLIGGLFLASTPWRVALANGQFTLVAIAATLLAVFLSEKNKHLLAGIALSVAMIKYPLTGLISFVFLLKGRWLSVGVMTGIHAILTIGAAYWLSENPFTLIWQSLTSNTGNLNLGIADLGIFLSPYPIAYAIVALILFGLFFDYLRRSKQGAMLPIVGVTLLLTLLLSYHRIYDFSALILPLALCLYSPSHNSRHWLWITFIGLIFFGERLILLTQAPYLLFQWTATVTGLLILGIEYRNASSENLRL